MGLCFPVFLFANIAGAARMDEPTSADRRLQAAAPDIRSFLCIVCFA